MLKTNIKTYGSLLLFITFMFIAIDNIRNSNVVLYFILAGLSLFSCLYYLIKSVREIEANTKGKVFLIDLYSQLLSESNEMEFRKALLKEAIEKLKRNVEPSRVESWVVRMEKNWDRI